LLGLTTPTYKLAQLTAFTAFTAFTEFGFVEYQTEFIEVVNEQCVFSFRQIDGEKISASRYVRPSILHCSNPLVCVVKRLSRLSAFL
jgi:hypothetical protein